MNVAVAIKFGKNKLQWDFSVKCLCEHSGESSTKCHRNDYSSRAHHIYERMKNGNNLERRKLKGILLMHINSWKESVKKWEQGFFKWCPLTGLGTVGFLVSARIDFLPSS